MKVEIVACLKCGGMQCWLWQNLTILFVSPGSTRFNQIYSAHIFITCEAHFEDMMRKRYEIFRLAIDSDKFYLWVHIRSDSVRWADDPPPGRADRRQP